MTVLSRGWHTEIAIPADLLFGGLAVFRANLPGARFVVFGYGKRTFVTARADRLGEYLLGPFPGPAVIEVFGLTAAPEQAFGPGNMVAFDLPRGGAAALSAFIGGDLAHNAAGRPLPVGPAGFPGSVFYAASSGYGIGHTCNDWVAQALHAAGLPVRADGVIFSGQVMNRAETAAERCRGAMGGAESLPQQGGAVPLAHTALPPGGTTTVVPGGALPPPKLELHAASPNRAAQQAARSRLGVMSNSCGYRLNTRTAAFGSGNRASIPRSMLIAV